MCEPGGGGGAAALRVARPPLYNVPLVWAIHSNEASEHLGNAKISITEKTGGSAKNGS